MSRHSRIHILNELMSYVKRYWRFYFFYSSIFLVWSLTDVSICLYALWKAMHKCWWFGYEDEDSYEAEGRFSVSFTILQESPAKKIAVELTVSLWKRSHSKWNCGRNHAQSHFDLRKFHDLQHRLSHQKIFSLLHQDDLDLLAHRRQIWATMLRLKARFLRIWTNDHQSFEWVMSDIFKNWRRMVFQC